MHDICTGRNARQKTRQAGLSNVLVRQKSRHGKPLYWVFPKIEFDLKKGLAPRDPILILIMGGLSPLAGSLAHLYGDLQGSEGPLDWVWMPLQLRLGNEKAGKKMAK